MVNFGTGLGAFMGGVSQGMQIGQQIKDVREARSIRKMEKEATGAASTARETDIASAITSSTDDAGNTSFSVGGNSFSTAADARKAAESQVGGFMDYYRSKAVPQLIEGYIKNGQRERAEQLQSYLDSHEGKARFKDWAGAAQRFAMGDMEGGFKGLAKLNGRLNNNADLVGYEPIKAPARIKLPSTGEEIDDPSGASVETGGWRVNWKDSKTGQQFSQDFTSADDFARTALWALSPENQVAYTVSDMTAAGKARRDAAVAAADDARDLNNEITKSRFKAVIDDQAADRKLVRDKNLATHNTGLGIQRDTVQSSLGMERDANRIQLEAATKLAGTTGEKPEDVRKSLETITKRLAETDLSFSKLTPQEQTQRAVEALKAQRSAARGVLGDTGAAPAASPLLY